MSNNLCTPPDPDAWKPEKSAADSSPESERRLDELVKQCDAWDADFKARKAALKAAGRDFNRFLKEHAAWSWSHDGLEFTLCRHDKAGHWCGYVRFPTRPVKELGFRGILAYVPVHGGISWAEDSPDGPEAMHRACLLRTVVGSVGHIKKACHCFGGCEEDPPGLTKRQGALAAEKLYLALAEDKHFFPT